MKNIAIKIDNVSKEYSLGNRVPTTIREAINNLFLKNTKKASFLALSNISLEIKKGQALGIVGKNGAGKSTLLKILSKITYPSKGEIEIEGRVTSLLEVGTGFHPELTGRENVFLNGSLLGMSKTEIKSKFNEIVLFSGVEKFIDTAIKHYSSGMQMRLAFAVAAHLDSEILLVDEVLAVGDYEFRKKCIEKMNSLSVDSQRTVLFVSHNLSALESLCDQSILIDKGRIIKQGNTRDIIKLYKNDVVENIEDTQIENYRQSYRSQEITVKKISSKNKMRSFSQDDNLTFKIEFESSISLKNLLIEFHVYNENAEKLFEVYSWDSGMKMDIFNENKTFKFDFGSLKLSSGVYYADIKIKNALGASAMDFIEMFPFFEIINSGKYSQIIKTDRDGFLTIIPKIEHI